jgi:hypothetical protein
LYNSSRFASRRGRRLSAVLVVITITGSVGACGDSLRRIGPTPAAAEANADQLFDAFRARFTGVELSPKYEAARLKLTQSALVPSRAFADDAVWEARPSAAVRALYVAGVTVDGHYRMETRPSLDAPLHPGDSRHDITLEQTSPSTFRWNTRSDIAIGTISAEDVSVLITSLFRAADGRTERELRDDYRAAFPRAMLAFGRGFSLDSLHTTTAAGGITSVGLTFAFHPELMRPAFPTLAAYFDKYLAPAKYHFVLADRAGAVLLDALGHDRTLTLRYRLQQGRLTSLLGPPRPWPDSLQLTSDLSLKVKVFTVGFHGLVTDFVLTNTGHDRAWAIIAQHEPRWDLPFVAERLLRSPLHRPFEGAGALFRLSVRDSAGGQSIFRRETRADVQESTIMRFLGSLASHAVGDLDTKVENEEHRFLSDGFVALRADLRDVSAHWRADEH